MLKTGMIVVAGLGLLTGKMEAQGTTALPSQVSSKTIVAISHRGEHLHHPENTLPAFQAAIDAHADYFELDVRTTSDGKLVLMHDKTADRTTNGSGPIEKMSLDQVRALDAGAKFLPSFTGTKVPTFDEALDLAHGKINVYVDTKNADPQLLIDTIERHDMQDQVVIYGDPFFLYDVHKLRPNWKVMPEALSLDICKMLLWKLKLKVVAFDADDFKPDVIDAAKKANALIYVDRLGSTDNPQGWQQAIDMGAAGIQTDHPAELVDYLRAHNLATH